jgi:predicted lipoprotein with Yx(FWY)xxD motif
MKSRLLAGRPTGIAVVLTLVFVVAVSTAAASAARISEGTRLMTRSSSLGKILVDAKGHTLYLFEKDKRNRSACSGQCAAFWPPLLTHGKPTAGAGVKASLLGVTRRSNGSTQVTYAGHPLYRFALDTRVGQTKGQGLEKFGAEWYVLGPNGKKIDKD